MIGCLQYSQYEDEFLANGRSSASASVVNLEAKSIEQYSCIENPHLEVEYHSEIRPNLFHLRGTLLLWDNCSYPYLILNATLLNNGRQVEKIKYLLIDAEPGKKQSFEISKNGRFPKEEYYCVLEVASPMGLLSSEKHSCLFIEESEVFAKRDFRFVEQPSKSPYLTQGQRDANTAKLPKSLESASSADTDQEYEEVFRADAAKPIKIEQRSPSETSKSSYVGKIGQMVEDEEMAKKQGSAISNSISAENNSMPKNGVDADFTDDDMLVGSSSSNKFHRLDCRYAAKIKNKIFFKDADEAKKRGKVPCMVCNPS